MIYTSNSVRTLSGHNYANQLATRKDDRKVFKLQFIQSKV